MTDGTAVVATRLRSQLLSGRRATSPEAVVERLLAVQAQDGRAARLTVRTRSTGLTAADVDDALTSRRTLVVTWLNRGTLHLVTADDYWWLHPLTNPQLGAQSSRRLRQEGVSPPQAARGIEVVTEAVRTGGPQTRAQLRQRLDEAGVPTAGQALVYVLFAASRAGRIVRGPVVGNELAFVSVPDWLGPAPAALDRDEALALLARRYLAGHRPAEPEDLATWAGVTLGDARGAFESAGAAPTARHIALPPPRLLGAFDPILHGWRSRAPFVGAHGGVVTSNGVFRPTALVDGRIVATWTLARGAIEIRPLERIPAAALDALVADAADVLRYLGLPAADTRVAATR